MLNELNRVIRKMLENAKKEQRGRQAESGAVKGELEAVKEQLRLAQVLKCMARGWIRAAIRP